MDGLGEALKEARTRKGLTGEQAAEGLGVSLRQIRRWEKDVNEPGAKRLQACAELYGSRVDKILTRACEIAQAARAPKKRGRAA